MKKQIQKIIREEVIKHKNEIEKYHVDTITSGIYKQLSEYMNDEIMIEFIHELKPEFIKVVDSLIPIVEEYETKINQILEDYIGRWVSEDLQKGILTE
ncbi:hypothetical protein GF362_02055 [Candidatus Dojkabacteria bacterium]|nr:hypothetical protein [Candidatus Dojkabacteria bacterium]